MRNNLANPHLHMRQAKTLALLKFTFLLLLLAAQARANDGYAQNTVTLTEKNVPINRVLKKIQVQTGYTYFAPVNLLQRARKISIDVKDVSLTYALDRIFEAQPLTYKIVQRVIIVQEKDEQKVSTSTTDGTDPIHEVRGRVTNAEGEPIEGANVMVKGTNKVVITNSKGEYILNGVQQGAVIEISFVGYERQSVVVKNQEGVINTLLAIASKVLDATIVQGYGTTTRRFNTGNIDKISSEQISKQPVGNPLAALHGRVAGLEIIQSSGLPGSTFKVQIRGQNSIVQGSEPLFIIDGVPFAPNNNPINKLPSSLTPANTLSYESGLSPFNTFNPSDIESIEILKDADATAIYGSRGANGVVLITTKRGKAGSTVLNVNIYNSLSKVTRTMELLNTRDYLQMRREAFANDGTTPTTLNAPDLLLWDTTRYTDFRKLLVGNTATTTDAQVSISGGSVETKFFLSAGYRRETTVFPGDIASKRGSVKANLNHTSLNKRLNANFSTIFVFGNNTIPSTDLMTLTDLPPNAPKLYDSTGNLNWQEGGVSFANPMGFLFKMYKAETNNLLSNINLSYKLFPGLTLKSNIGYNFFSNDESSLFPKKSFDPASTSVRSSLLGNNSFKSWILEPQAQYNTAISKGFFEVLIGATWQQTLNKGSYISASGFTNDAQLEHLEAATTVDITNSYSKYRYTAFFGRINYNWDKKYVLNVSGRRDGSSRFGPGKQFANFSAVGLAWIVSEESFMKQIASFLSFGKLRASYGTAGNDQIGDYEYLDGSSSTSTPYQGTPGLFPTQLFNSDYRWEMNRKLEGAVELGFLNDRIFLSVAYFKNRTGNQLVSYRLPTQTGFASVFKNLPAVVQNKGWEFELNTTNITSSKFNWSSGFNLTIHRNKLISFPGLAESSYSTTYVEGQPLNVLYTYNSLGVNPLTGIYEFQDVNQDGSLNSKDFLVLGNLTPKFYGGFVNSFSLGNFKIDFLFEFKQQLGRKFWFRNSVPGTMNNQPLLVLDRWKKAGDITAIGRYTTTTNNSAYQAANRLITVNNAGRYTDASYIRFKNISVSYSLPSKMLDKIHIKSFRIYLLGQNLATITDYQGADPETQNLYSLPSLQTYTAGIQITF